MSDLSDTPARPTPPHRLLRGFSNNAKLMELFSDWLSLVKQESHPYADTGHLDLSPRQKIFFYVPAYTQPVLLLALFEHPGNPPAVQNQEAMVNAIAALLRVVQINVRYDLGGDYFPLRSALLRLYNFSTLRLHIPSFEIRPVDITDFAKRLIAIRVPGGGVVDGRPKTEDGLVRVAIRIIGDGEHGGLSAVEGRKLIRRATRDVAHRNGLNHGIGWQGVMNLSNLFRLAHVNGREALDRSDRIPPPRGIGPAISRFKYVYMGGHLDLMLREELLALWEKMWLTAELARVIREMAPPVVVQVGPNDPRLPRVQHPMFDHSPASGDRTTNQLPPLPRPETPQSTPTSTLRDQHSSVPHDSPAPTGILARLRATWRARTARPGNGFGQALEFGVDSNNEPQLGEMSRRAQAIYGISRGEPNTVR